MNTAFPLIAIAVAVASLALSRPPETKPSKANPLAALVFIVLLVIAGFVWKADYANLLPAALSFAVGIAVAYVLRIVEGVRMSSAAAAFGFATALSGAAMWLDPSYMQTVQLAAIAGLGFGAWLSGDLRSPKLTLPLSTATAAAMIFAADFMGAKALQNEPGGATGTMLGLAGAIAAMIALVANRSEKSASGSLGFVQGFIGVGILLIFGYVVGGRLVESKEAWMIFNGSVVAAVLLHWVVRPDAKDDSLAFLIGSVIWIGIATLAFAFLKGFGMTIAATGAILTLLMLGNPRALLSAGPLIGLAFYRVLRESHPDAVRALDIGQHYAVVGVAFGVIAGLLPTEWIAKRYTETVQSGIGRLLWAVVLALLPVAMAVVLGAKGMVGFVAGLGFAALVEGLRNGSSLIPVVFAGGLAAIVAVSYDWLSKLLDLTREGKQTAFLWIAGVAIVLGILIALVSKPSEETEPQLS